VWGTDFESVPGREDLRFTLILATGATSGVFLSGEYVVRNQMDHPSSSHRRIHCLLADNHFTRAAAAVGVAPKTVFLSPSEFLPSNPDIETEFKMEYPVGADFKCSQKPPRSIYGYASRGVSAREYTEKKKSIPLREAVEYGKRAIELLQRLHREAALLHCDVHLENVCIAKADPRTLKHIYFEKSLHIRHETAELISLDLVRLQHTPWQVAHQQRL